MPISTWNSVCVVRPLVITISHPFPLLAVFSCKRADIRNCVHACRRWACIQWWSCSWAPGQTFVQPGSSSRQCQGGRQSHRCILPAIAGLQSSLETPSPTWNETQEERKLEVPQRKERNIYIMGAFTILEGNVEGRFGIQSSCRSGCQRHPRKKASKKTAEYSFCTLPNPAS